TIVDVGFGQAEELDELARVVGESGRVVGIEREEARVNKATEKLGGIPNIRVLFGNALDIPLPDRSADCVLLKGVLHEIAKISKALSEAGRVCNPDGTIVIVDFMAFPRDWLRNSNLHWRLHHPGPLLSKPMDRHPGFSKTNLEEQLESAGLRMRAHTESVMTGRFGDHEAPLFFAVAKRS
ncbi:MAG TPA: methyltransferase domain-containing protein, partial [Candidatus Bathyarchaeia archaeon]|nr:methyltransferase domain-containing protein [Candidatus Bathyarchaeia archaeon]